jgi:hypothetical protein
MAWPAFAVSPMVGCAHRPIVVGTRKPDELPTFH